MITAETIRSANERVKKIEIGTGNKKKFYTSVAARVAAFREMCATGTIVTEIVSMADGVVTMKATVSDETGRVLATGLAQEKESSSFINKTSYIENCETSAVGRALGMLGIGSDEQMASAEELVNAINNQNQQSQRSGAQQQNQRQQPQQSQQKIQPVTPETIQRAVNEPCSDIELATLEALTRKAFPNTPIEQIFPTWGHLTKEQYAKALTEMKKRLGQ